MSPLRVACCAILFATLAPAAPALAHGAEPGLMSGMKGKPTGEPGDWVEYVALEKGKPLANVRSRVMISPGQRGPSSMYFEMWLDAAGDTALRIEYDNGRPVEDAEIHLKMLRAYYALDVAGEQAVCGGGSCREPGPGEESSERFIEEVDVKTKAGTFRARHTAQKTSTGDIHYWHSIEVPIMRLVRMELPSGKGFELVGMGRNGKSAFPNKVQVVPFPFGTMEGAMRAMMPQLVSPARAPKKEKAKSDSSGTADAEKKAGDP